VQLSLSYRPKNTAYHPKEEEGEEGEGEKRKKLRLVVSF
jgi:hypothetical protein